jgi:hypothetical protein
MFSAFNKCETGGVVVHAVDPIPPYFTLKPLHGLVPDSFLEPEFALISSRKVGLLITEVNLA